MRASLDRDLARYRDSDDARDRERIRERMVDTYMQVERCFRSEAASGIDLLLRARG